MDDATETPNDRAPQDGTADVTIMAGIIASQKSYIDALEDRLETLREANRFLMDRLNKKQSAAQ